MANSFFSAFSKIPIICASIKAESKLKCKERKKHAFSGVQNSKFRICFSAFVLLCKRKFHAHFHKKVIFRPLGIFLKMKTLPHVCRLHALKIWIGTSKIIPDLWLSAVLCPTKKIKKITPPYSAHALAHTRLYRIRRTPCKNRAHKSA